MECAPFRTKQFLPSHIRQARLETDGSLNRLMQRVNYPQCNIWLKVLKLHSVSNLRITGLIRFQHKAVTSRFIFVIETQFAGSYFLNIT